MTFPLNAHIRVRPQGLSRDLNRDVDRQRQIYAMSICGVSGTGAANLAVIHPQLLGLMRTQSTGLVLMFSQFPLEDLLTPLISRLIGARCIGLAGHDVNRIALAHWGTALFLCCQQFVDQAAVPA